MKSIIGFSCLILVCLCQTLGTSDNYRGAVVEYHPVISKNGEEASVAANVENYVKYMADAKQKEADIIVFPENGLLTNTIQSPIPDPADRISPCDSTTFATTEAVKKLSCASKANKIYSVVNLREKRTCSKDDKNCPPRGYYIYNTNVGFDRAGVVVARYSKFNLYDEPLVNKTERPEMSVFETDFGVRFGLFTCFDILFPTPALKLVKEHNVTDFIYTTHWFSELPFLTALQIQRGWAEMNNVNLLASGLNNPKSASCGSGIYNGKYGDLCQEMPEVPTTRLLIAKIQKIGSANTLGNSKQSSPNYTHIKSYYTEVDAEAGGMTLWRDHMQLFQSQVIEVGEEFEETICSGDNFCCEFQVLVTSLVSDTKNYTPRAIVFDGVRKFGATFKGGVQSCGVVLCNGPDIMNCTSRLKNMQGMFEFTEIKVKGGFKLENSFQMPSTLTDGKRLEPLSANKYKFKKKKKHNKMQVSLELLWPSTDLQAFGIWGRDFSRDNGASLMATPGLFLCFIVSVVCSWNFGFFSS